MTCFGQGGPGGFSKSMGNLVFHSCQWSAMNPQRLLARGGSSGCAVDFPSCFFLGFQRWVTGRILSSDWRVAWSEIPLWKACADVSPPLHLPQNHHPSRYRQQEQEQEQARYLRPSPYVKVPTWQARLVRYIRPYLSNPNCPVVSRILSTSPFLVHTYCY
jgi:hypothetical protein